MSDKSITIQEAEVKLPNASFRLLKRNKDSVETPLTFVSIVANAIIAAIAVYHMSVIRQSYSAFSDTIGRCPLVIVVAYNNICIIWFVHLRQSSHFWYLETSFVAQPFT